MTVLLAKAAGSEDGVLVLDSAVTVGSLTAPFMLDAEAILVSGGAASRLPSVERGQNGTAKAPHAAGTELVRGWGGAGTTPDLAQVLAQGTDADGNQITNLSDPSNAQDAATKEYVDTHGAPFPTYNQTLAPDSPADGDTWLRSSLSGYPDNYGRGLFVWNDGQTQWQPVASVVLDVDGNLLGLITIGPDGNILLARYVEGSIVSELFLGNGFVQFSGAGASLWGSSNAWFTNGAQIKNVSDPSDAQDVATKNYVDAAIPVTPSIGAVLAAGTDADGNQIKDLADPTDAQDAATKASVDAAIAAALSPATGVVGVANLGAGFVTPPHFTAPVVQASNNSFIGAGAAVSYVANAGVGGIVLTDPQSLKYFSNSFPIAFDTDFYCRISIVDLLAPQTNFATMQGVLTSHAAPTWPEILNTAWPDFSGAWNVGGMLSVDGSKNIISSLGGNYLVTISVDIEYD